MSNGRKNEKYTMPKLEKIFPMVDKTTGIPVIIVCLTVAVEIVVPEIQDDPKGCAVAMMEVFYHVP